MCGRYRLTQRRLLEIENYYGVDDVNDLDIGKREYNISPTEMAAYRVGQRRKKEADGRLLVSDPVFEVECLAS